MRFATWLGHDSLRSEKKSQQETLSGAKKNRIPD